MLGQDTIYSTKLNDLELMVKAKKECRILITRNLKLYKKSVKNKIQSFYIKTQNNSEALANLRNRFGIPLVIDMKFSHCPLCNIKLQSIKKQEAAKKIKPNTLLYYDDFWFCSNCLSIYWQGSHWKDITLALDKAKNFSKF